MRYLLAAAGFLILISACEAGGTCRRRSNAVERGRQCKRPCATDGECKGTQKRCRCDGACGMSCFNPAAACAALGEIEDGSFTTTKTTIGGVASYRCNAGFVISGSRERRCYADKNWHPAEPTCKPGCGTPGKVGSSYPVASKSSFDVGEKVRYKCYTGYFTNDVAPDRTCLRSGWSRAQFHCELKRCSPLSEVYKGEISYTKEQFFGSTAKLTCVPGYEPETFSTTIRCYAGEGDGQYGEWSGRLTSCRIKTCAPPLPPDNGIIRNRYTVQRDYGSQIFYECNIGFKLEGRETGVCEDDRSWGRMPNCTLDPDCNFEEYSNPTCGYANDRSLWRRVRVTKNGLPGYVSEARSDSSKLTSAIIPQDWSSEDTICLMFEYKLLSDGSSLEISYTGSHYHPGISWRSNENEAVNQWLDSLLNIRSDRPIQYQFNAITPPIQIDNVKVSKAACVDYCQRRPCRNRGTCVSRSTTRKCFCSIEFKGSDCQIDRKCSRPPEERRNARLVGSIQNIHLPQTSVTYRCDRDYKLSGYQYRGRIQTTVTPRCVEDNQGSDWSPSLDGISCTEIVCSPPPVGDNQHLSQEKRRWTVGEEAVVRCNDGFDFYSENVVDTITCGSDEQWSDTFTRCQDVRCPKAPILIPNGRRTSLSDDSFFFGATATYECNTNYKFAGKRYEVVTRTGVRCRRRWFGQRSLWDPDISSLRCIDRRCSAPPPIKKASRPTVGLINGALLPESSVTYTCIENYKLENYRTIKTQIKSRCNEGYDNGRSFWTPALGTIRCIKKVCPVPTLGENQEMSGAKREWGVGEKAVVTCESGYDFVSKNAVKTITCSSDEQWSDQFTRCQDVRCPTPKATIYRGRRIGLSNRPLSSDSTATYECNPNYKFGGKAGIVKVTETTCRRRWQGQISYWDPKITSLYCVAILCSDPPIGIHQVISNYSSEKRWRVGDQATYRCKAGYEFDADQPSTKLICGSNGRWEGSITPCKEDLRCVEPPTRIGNANRSYISGFPLLPNATAAYKCDDGYKIEGERDSSSKRIQCQRRVELGSEWVPDVSSVNCIRVNCSKPIIGNNQRILNTKAEWYAGDTASYGCQAGYKFDSENPVSVNCGSDGVWTGETPPCVEDKRCSEPPKEIRHGWRAFMSNPPLLPNATATYKCHDGYKMEIASDVISRKIHCRKKREGLGSEWDPSVSNVTCIRVTCSKPVVDHNQRLSNAKSVWYAGDIASYRCIEGYMFGSENPVNVSCGNDGVWSGQAPQCVEDKTCGEPPNKIDHGRRSFMSKKPLLPNATATYMCDEGYKMQSRGDEVSQTIHCLKRKYRLGSRWTPNLSRVTCIRVNCSMPILGENQRLSNSKSVWYAGDNASYRCEEGYKFVSANPEIISCGNNGVWSGAATPCVEGVTCMPPIFHTNLLLDGKSTWQAGDMATFGCIEGYVFNSEDPVKKISCGYDGRWSGEPTPCVEGGCDAPAQVENARPVSSTATYADGARVKSTCLTGYQLDGDAYRICQHSEWLPKYFRCRLQSCTVLREVPDGVINYTNEQYYGSNATVSCLKGFEPKSPSYTTISCQAGDENDRYGEWSGSLTSCRRKTCVQPVSPANGSIRNQRAEEMEYEYESPITYECNAGYKLAGNETGTCQDDGGWGEVPTCALDLDCDFQDSTRPTCGYRNENSRWKRVRVHKDGLPDYVSEAKYRPSILTSALIPQDWSDEDTICLKFRYKLLQRDSSFRILYTSDHYHPDITWNSHGSEARNVWHDSQLSIRTNRPIQFQFQADVPTIQIDDVKVLKRTCGTICVQPVAPANGFIVNRHAIRMEYGSRITYECNTGYMLEGSETGTCQGDRGWGEVPNCTPDLDCGFQDSTRPTCGYGNENSLWRRVATNKGYVSEARYGASILTSALIPQDWSDEDSICLKFRYKLLQRDSSFRVQYTPGHYHPDITWSSHGREKRNVWLDSLLNIRTDRPIQFQFQADVPTIQIDDVEVLKRACDDHCRGSPCQNGGTCLRRSDRRVCLCPVGFRGSSNCGTAQSKSKLDLAVLIPGNGVHETKDLAAYKDWLKMFGKSIIPSNYVFFSLYQYGLEYFNYRPHWRSTLHTKVGRSSPSHSEFQRKIDHLDLEYSRSYSYLTSGAISSLQRGWGRQKWQGWIKILIILVERVRMNGIDDRITCLQYSGINVYIIGINYSRTHHHESPDRLRDVTSNFQFVEFSLLGSEESQQSTIGNINNIAQNQKNACLPPENAPQAYTLGTCRWQPNKQRFDVGDKVPLECKYHWSRIWTRLNHAAVCIHGGSWITTDRDSCN